MVLFSRSESTNIERNLSRRLTCMSSTAVPLSTTDSDMPIEPKDQNLTWSSLIEKVKLASGRTLTKTYFTGIALSQFIIIQRLGD
eukprot:COSAG02_NODE_982_length_15475_cov_30.378674_9_plen_85_part_00